MRLSRFTRLSVIGAVLASAATGGLVLAQIEGGDRGVVPVASSGDFEIDDVQVDVSAKTPDDARLGGWRLAQRKAWKTLSERLGGGGAAVGDGTLDGLVNGIVVQSEQIGPTRYIATLGVVFDRARAGALLGVSAYVSHSEPMLVVPIEVTGGAEQVFEHRTAWQEAWARFRTGNSAVDYVRPMGSGPDPLLINAGLVDRRGRGWWRTVLNQYGASNVVIPQVRLFRQWPGGPVIGVFQARYGPDNSFIGQAMLRVPTADALPQLLDEGVRRMDALFTRAIQGGQLRSDPGLAATPPGLPQPEATPTDTVAEDAVGALITGNSTIVTVQFDTPNAGAVAAAESAMRGVPGVSQAATTSLALGGVSLMRVAYAGTPDALKAALEARGWQVLGAGATLRIRRAPQLLPPEIGTDASAAG